MYALATGVGVATPSRQSATAESAVPAIGKRR